MRLAILLAVLAIAAACTRGHDTRDTRCPSGSTTVTAGDRPYCLVTCAGALEDRVWEAGLDFLGSYDDGLVYTPQHHDLHGVLVPSPETVPPEVCAKLRHGCACTTPACTYAARKAAAQQAALHDPARFDELTRMPPRCERDDPSCGPERFDHTCADDMANSDRPRRPVLGDKPTRDPHFACTYDGQCVDSGCGYQCLSTAGMDTGMAYTCLGIQSLDRALANAACGCVHDRCTWFKQ